MNAGFRHPSILSRLVRLVRGLLGAAVSDAERAHPRAVYEQALDERLRRYAKLKDAVAGILYLRQKIEGEIGARSRELARVEEELRCAVARDDDEAALALIAHRQALSEDIGRAEQELASVRDEAAEAKASLLRFQDEIRALEREKVRSLAKLASADARRRLRETFASLSIDADVRALDRVREDVGRSLQLGQLEGELERGALDARLRRIRAEARESAARRELDEWKARLRPRLLAARAAPLATVAAARAGEPS
ncbi:MAG TPA: PspA/IM30 family protein [Myxococcota bacterium]|jgi:phage shock protein A|nr:PspA/IM30 family protein [Myxococcota bacterium]